VLKVDRKVGQWLEEILVEFEKKIDHRVIATTIRND
jgi:hypothetical protein